jgi:hypothetical protein
MTDYKLTLDTEKARILFSSLLNTQVECRMIEEDKEVKAKYPTLVGMAQLTTHCDSRYSKTDCSLKRRMKMKQSESIANLAAAMAAAQGEMGAAVKGSSNPFFKSKYASLGDVIEAVKAPFAAHGLSYVQFPVSGEALSA